MQKTTLYEESAISSNERKEAKFYSAFRIAAYVFFVLTAIAVGLSFTLISSVFASTEETGARALGIVMVILFDLSFLGMGLGSWFMKNRFNISYDYIFVEDELRLTKVYNGRKRKFLTKIHVDKILRIGWVEKPSFDEAVRSLQGKKPHVLTPNREPPEGKEWIYILCLGELGRTIYILECRRMMLETLVFAAGKNKFERE